MHVPEAVHIWLEGHEPHWPLQLSPPHCFPLHCGTHAPELDPLELDPELLLDPPELDPELLLDSPELECDPELEPELPLARARLPRCPRPRLGHPRGDPSVPPSTRYSSSRGPSSRPQPGVIVVDHAPVLRTRKIERTTARDTEAWVLIMRALGARQLRCLAPTSH
jgi:hypothetical protein